VPGRRFSLMRASVAVNCQFAFVWLLLRLLRLLRQVAISSASVDLLGCADRGIGTQDTGLCLGHIQPTAVPGR
jgi:hypothetical protein